MEVDLAVPLDALSISRIGHTTTAELLQCYTRPVTLAPLAGRL